ncbi:MAG: prepilin-type N-terminal cleavage/methylation domain-containing protein [Candidatus Omnitrophota bacterium]
MQQNKNGFTLVEMMIVVVILGILATIAVPNYINATERSKVSQAISDLKNLRTAQITWFHENAAYSTDIINELAPLLGTVALNPGTSVNWNYVANADGSVQADRIPPAPFTGTLVLNIDETWGGTYTGIGTTTPSYI